MTVCVAVLVMLVVALAGLVITLRIDHRDREDVDRELIALAGKVQQDLAKLRTQGDGPQDGSDDYGGLLAGSPPIVRLLSGNEVSVTRGGQVSLPLPDTTGFSTVTSNGQTWRSLVHSVGATGERLQVLQNTDSLEHRLADNRGIAITVAVAGTALAALGVWVIVGLVFAPLQRLRDGARRILPGEADRRLPSPARPQEVADLSATLNGMLERLQTSMLATRRFTADAGHELRTPLTSLGIDLETLLRNPTLPEPDRHRTLAAMTVEHKRLVALLDGLQALARGDAGALPSQNAVDLVDLVSESVARATHRHPDITYQFTTTVPNLAVNGWETGLRLAIDNLLENAATHGHPHGTVNVSLSTTPEFAFTHVADNGPGIPTPLRDDMKRRFTRGPRPRTPGSGLGLALVDQQAHLHGGRLDLNTSPSGGLLATLVLPLLHTG